MKNLINYIKESEDIQKIRYVGIELDEESKQKLIEYYIQHNPWPESSKLYCEHSTIAFGSDVSKIIDWLNENNDEKIVMTAFAIGHNDKSCAVKVKYGVKVPCQNKIPHITLATNIVNKGKPVNSNDITEWKDIDNIQLLGTVKKYF